MKGWNTRLGSEMGDGFGSNEQLKLEGGCKHDCRTGKFSTKTICLGRIEMVDDLLLIVSRQVGA